MPGNELRLRFGYGFVFPAATPPRADLTWSRTCHGHRVADPYRWLEDAGLAGDPAVARRRGRAVGRLPRRPAAPGGVHRAGARAAARRLRRPARLARDDAGSTRGATRTRSTRCSTSQVDDRQLGTGRPATRERALIDPVAIDPTGRTTLDAWSAGQGGTAARLPALARRGRGVAAAGDGRRHRGARRRAHRPVPLLRGGLAARRQGVLLHAAAAARGGARGRGAVPPAGVPARGGDAAGGGHARCSARAGTRRPTTASASAGTAAG